MSMIIFVVKYDVLVFVPLHVFVVYRNILDRVVHGLGWPMGWVGLGWVGLGRVGLGWVGLGRDFSVIGGLGGVGSITAKVLKIWKDYFNAFKARLDKIWLHQAVKFHFMADLTGNGNWSEGVIKR